MTDKKIEPIRKSDGLGWVDHGPRNIEIDKMNPNILVPPATDHGTLPNLRFSFSNAHQRLCEGGWAREVTSRELPAVDNVAGVNMALAPGAIRELHWHKETEWGLMLYGNARVTALDEEGRSFIDDVGVGDIWNFESGVPHSIQALDEGCEFLLIFSEPDFSDDSTFLLSDWLRHTPADIVAANFNKTIEEIAPFPKENKYIFNAPVPGPMAEAMPYNDKGEVPSPFTYHIKNAVVHQSEAGTARIVDQTVFPVAKTISAAFVEVEPGGMRELHWHPKASEWQYYLQGKAMMTVFDSEGLARTFDYSAGDVGFVPNVAGHYILNTGTETLRFLEVFKYPTYSEISLAKWMATTPVAMVAEHLNVTEEFVESMPKRNEPQPVVWYDKSKQKFPVE